MNYIDKANELYRNLLVKKKKRGLEDLLYFNKYILENDPGRRKLIVPHVHGEWWEWYKNSKARIKMILVPRGTFKSTFFTIGRTIQALCQNRDNRVLIANATLPNSQKFLGEIKDHLRKNSVLTGLYGEFYDKDLKWNETEIEILGRSLGVREASITAAGVGGNLVSQHYSMIVADDLVNNENSATRYLADKTIDWWKRAFSLLDYDGEMVIIGTRWSYYELYSWILDKYPGQIDAYIRGAYKEDESLYFPELLSEDKLEELRGLQGSYIFSAFYLNNPVDADSALIKESQILYWGEGEDKQLPGELETFALCDPAVSQREDADDSCIIVVSTDSKNNWYVREVRSGKWTVGTLVEELFNVYEKWKPTAMTIEVIGQAQGLLTPIHDMENTKNKFLPLVEITSRPPLAKATRIRSVLQPRFERGKVFIKRDMVELQEQLLKFPRYKRDDMIDALTDMEEVSFPAPEPITKDEVPQSHFEKILKEQAERKLPHADEVMGENF